MMKQSNEIKRGNKKFIGVLLLLWLAVTAAESVLTTSENNTTPKNTAVNNTQTQIGTAQDWGLTASEWAQYRHLMQGQNRLWYPQLSPTAVLGINAATPQEQQHFAALVAQQEHDKLARELAFDNAVHTALQQLYATEPVIKPANLSAFNPVKKPLTANTVHLQSGDHLVLFTPLKNGMDFALPRLIAEIQNHPDIVLDIFCLGKNDDNAIRSWAKLNNLPKALVAAGRITLNADNGQLEKVIKTTGTVVLPYVLLVHEGESQPVSVWNLHPSCLKM